MCMAVFSFIVFMKLYLHALQFDSDWIVDRSNYKREHQPGSWKAAEGSSLAVADGFAVQWLV